jgi:ATP-dependent Lon protease
MADLAQKSAVAADRERDPAQLDETAAAIAVEATSTDLPQQLPPELPVLPVRGVVVFPGTVVPLTIGREKSKAVIDAVLAGDKLVAIFAQRNEDTADPTIDDIYRVGSVCTVLKLLRMPDGTNSLLVHGLRRVGIERMTATEPYWRAIVHAHEDSDSTGSDLELQALAHTARQTAHEVMELSPNIPEEAAIILDNIEKPGPLADFLAANLSLGLVQKQELLETFDIADRLRKIAATLNNQLEILKLSQKIQSDVRREIDKTQRDYYLNEQLKAIRRELGGEEDGEAAAIEDLKKKLDEAGLPEVARKEADRELARLSRISSQSPEHGVIRDYLEWLAEMPWNTSTEEYIDLAEAERILDEDHFGLEKVKRRILEYLAVRKLKQDGRGPILCLVGPPGVGKTSLGVSIARALNRKFSRVALGGVRDEADIRGHRRTYIGAIPGRVIQELRKAGVNNPVMMLDEIDKLGRDMRGDPAAALLEVLDPQQNQHFTDHYLAVPFDLSRVLFIATANWLDPVDPPLRDRMEIIELSGYSIDEKVEIAARYLLPRQLAENGLTPDQLQISRELLQEIVNGYTREAGVRALEQKIGAICRGIAARVARGARVEPKLTDRVLYEILGPHRFESETRMIAGEPGVATGLAYTPVGGQILFIEATGMPGRGSFQITGQLGDVMRESAQAALSLARANAGRWGLDLSALPNTDIHVHIPAGAIPKDGPSAGLALTTALVSLLSGKPVSPDVAMTGEITLRGLVLPVGGIKEKVLAAHYAGVTTVILPQRNQPDLAEVPPQVREKLNFVYVDRVEPALAAAIPGFGDTTVEQPPIAAPNHKPPMPRPTKPSIKQTDGRRRTRQTPRATQTEPGAGRPAARPQAGRKSTGR